MSEEWLEVCEACEGKGCAACRQQGYVAHLCASDDELDEVAALLAYDDQLKADIYRDCQILAHMYHSLLDQAIDERTAGTLTDTWLNAYLCQ